MTRHIYPLRLNVGFLFNKALGFSRDFYFEYPELFIPPDLEVKDFRSDLVISRTREGLLVSAKIKGEITAACVRCLSDFSMKVDSQFDELFVFSERIREDTDSIIPEDGNLDFSEFFRDCLLLEIPINAVCKPDCKGLCPICGENQNLTTCHHDQTE